MGLRDEGVHDRSGDFRDDSWLILQDQQSWRVWEGRCESSKVVAFSSTHVYQEDFAVRRIETFDKALSDGVEVGLVPHSIASTVSLHELIEVACFRGVCA